MECNGNKACWYTRMNVQSTSQSIVCTNSYSCYNTYIVLNDNLDNEFAVDVEAEYTIFLFFIFFFVFDTLMIMKLNLFCVSKK